MPETPHERSRTVYSLLEADNMQDAKIALAIGAGTLLVGALARKSGHPRLAILLEATSFVSDLLALQSVDLGQYFHHSAVAPRKPAGSLGATV